MKKMPCLFVREFHSHNSFTLTEEVTPGCEWVLKGLGIATQKFDGSATFIFDGKVHKRYDAKKGKTPPEGFVPCGEPDLITGHHPGWILCSGKPDEKWHAEALINTPSPLEDGTYELCGPKVNANKEKLDKHVFLKHGSVVYPDVPRTFEGIKTFLSENMIEGIVFHIDTPVGLIMCKIRRHDFGFNW